MADYSINVKLNPKQAEKSLKDLKKQTKDLGKEKISFDFGGDFKTMASGELAKQIKILRSSIKEMEPDFVAMSKAGGAGANTVLSTIQNRQNAIKGLQARQAQLTGGSGGRGGLGSLTEAFPSLGGVARFATSPAGVVAGVGAAAYWQYNRQLGYAKDYTRMQGFGYNVKDTDRFVNTGYKNMYSKQESLQMAQQWLQATGKEGAFGTALSATRAFGLDFDTMTGVGEAGRRAGGDQKKNFIDMMSRAVTSGVEDARLGEYLKVQTGLLTQFVNQGPVSSSFITSLLSNITKNGGEYFRNNPQAGAQAYWNLSEGLKSQGQGGSSFGLLAPNIMKQFPGVQGALDIQTLTSTGLGGGASLKGMNIPTSLKKYYEEIGMYDDPAKKMQALYDSYIGGLSGRGMQTALTSLVGAGNVPQAAAALETWKQGGLGAEDAAAEFQKLMDEKTKTVEENQYAAILRIDTNIQKIKDKVAAETPIGKNGPDTSKFYYPSGINPHNINQSTKDAMYKFKEDYMIGEMQGLDPSFAAAIGDKLQGQTITSVLSGQHMRGSKHPLGGAVDVRTKDMMPWEKQELLDNVNSSQELKGILEDVGKPNEHLHVQKKENQSYVNDPVVGALQIIADGVSTMSKWQEKLYLKNVEMAREAARNKGTAANSAGSLVTKGDVFN